MKVLFVGSEANPYAKVGGLADILGSLPHELARSGHDARLFLPGYQMILEDPRWHAKKIASRIQARVNTHWVQEFDLWQVDGPVPVYLIATDRWFCDADRSEKVYQIGADPYLFFSVAVLEATRTLKWKPDVVHAHDWQTGFIPVLMREREPARWDQTATIFTIHNLAYQGEFGNEILEKLELPSYLFNPSQLETYGGVNFLKSGCAYADAVTTVSPTYAEEIQTSQFGCKLEGLMRHLKAEGRLYGILNGIDTKFFDPERDPYLAEPFSARRPEGKRACRKALLKEIGLEPMRGVPVAGVVTRLGHQKGMDLLLENAEELLRHIQLVVLGTGDPVLATGFRHLQLHYPERCRFFEGFSENLAPQIYAGSDIFLMPSYFEPCGLGQMIAMRYGTVPVVRGTGGLADTVFEGQNGFVFKHAEGTELVAAVARAADAYRQSAVWKELMNKGMATDFAWNGRKDEYLAVFEKALAARRAPVALEA